ncbi:hypothetical protein ACFYS8_30845 [Kitasatospora sp. NPDC004615]|uniref:hypothetical protein n=1 Tax=Kitasatospora sp. NPDC004615 TaxID=3364017 RepID=UPI0036741038
MRTNHAKRPRRSDTPRHRWGRPRAAVAAGGVLAAQILGLILGATDAHATGSGRTGPATRALTPGPAVPAAERGLLGGPTPTLDGAVGDLGAVLQGELPLPGQHSKGPDAFAIAARLLSTVPSQARPEDDRASRERPVEPAAKAPAPRTPDDPAAEATPLPTRRHVDNLTTTRDRLPPPPDPTPEHDAALSLTASPADPDDNGSTAAVLLPIAAGLLLTAAATYKHRGLPRGH